MKLITDHTDHWSLITSYNSDNFRLLEPAVPNLHVSYDATWVPNQAMTMTMNSEFDWCHWAIFFQRLLHAHHCRPFDFIWLCCVSIQGPVCSWNSISKRSRSTVPATWRRSLRQPAVRCILASHRILPLAWSFPMTTFLDAAVVAGSLMYHSGIHSGLFWDFGRTFASSIVVS